MAPRRDATRPRALAWGHRRDPSSRVHRPLHIRPVADAWPSFARCRQSELGGDACRSDDTSPDGTIGTRNHRAPSEHPPPSRTGAARTRRDRLVVQGDARSNVWRPSSPIWRTKCAPWSAPDDAAAGHADPGTHCRSLPPGVVGEYRGVRASAAVAASRMIIGCPTTPESLAGHGAGSAIPHRPRPPACGRGEFPESLARLS